MLKKMQFLLRKITPVLVVGLIGIIFLLIQFFIPDQDYNIFAYLFIFIIFLGICIAIDRVLITRVAYKTMLIGETILITIITFWYLYSTKYTEINIETSKPYFFVIYGDGGIKENDIPANGLFNKSLLVKTDTIIKVDYSLYNVALIRTPKNWNSYSTIGIDTVLNEKKVILDIYSKGDQMSGPEKIQLLRSEIERMGK